MKYIKNLFSNEVSEREKKHRELAYTMATEGIVLLKNDGTLPLSEKTIALFGAGASRTIKGGTGSGEVNERGSVSIFDGLKNAGYEVTSEKWINDYESDFSKAREEYGVKIREGLSLKNIIAGRMADIISLGFVYPIGRLIEESDFVPGTKVAIYVIARQSGEGNDRKIELGENDLQDIELKNINFLTEHFEKVILVINSGCSLNLDPIKNLPINAIIFFTQQGTEGGRAFADILNGTISPSGKLTSTWPKKYEDLPFSHEFSYLNGDLNNEYYKEGIYVGYRYFDSFNVEPLYPFGYGLSYTNFELKCKDVLVKDTDIYIEVMVKNTGDFKGKEVVECYLSSPNGTVDKEYQSLVGFAKTSLLNPGQEERVEISFDMANCGYFDESTSSYKLDKGNYYVRVGNQSRNTKIFSIITIDKDVVLRKVEHILKSEKKITELKSKPYKFPESYANAREVELSSRAFNFEKVVYSSTKPYHDERVDAIMKELSTKDMIDIVNGSGFISKNAFTVPGAVGSTTSKFVDKGLANVLLSDGPAGLRLQRTSSLTKSNKVKMIDYQFAFFEYLPKIALNFVKGNPKKDRLLYQYTTAFPVGMSVSQMWNKELTIKFGEAVSDEMSEFGVTYWLAPGMNICRNPLCGRNFEYYSEDPFLSGTIASCAVKGVQSIEGHYATVKHFFANNQEDNRNVVSSNADERTFREIYLKNFEIAIKVGKTKAIMTSYNKANGTYTPNSKDLCTSFARCECGFDGVIMTDWYSTAKSRASNALCIKAGNDLIMPGSNAARKDLIKGLRKKIYSKDDLYRSTSYVVRSIIYSHDYDEILSKVK